MKWAAAFALALAGAVTVASVQAQPNAAKEAYDRGAEAFSRKGYAEAAASFALADRLDPNPVALEAGFKAVLLADDPVLGMELVERAAIRPTTPKIDSYVTQAKAAFGARAGKLSATCADERGCTVKLNGVSLELGKQHWVRSGMQTLDVTVEGTTTTAHVEIKASAVVDFVAPAPPRPSAPEAQHPQPSKEPKQHSPARVTPAPPPAEHGAGLHRAVFGVTIGLFAVASAVTTWSGFDTIGYHDSYVSGDDSARDPGMYAQDRTNVLLGITIGGAIATTLVAIFTDWGAKKPHALAPRTLTLSF